MCALRHLAACLLGFLMAVLLAFPAAFAAESGAKTVRVGWYDSLYCFKDSLGQRTGIAYEYQQKIAAYTGWKYEYVEDSWPNLLRKLRNGEIDLLSDVSYTDDRAKDILYSAFPMGTESYFLYVSAKNRAAVSSDFSSMDSWRIGVNQGSVQVPLIHEWAAKNQVFPVIIPMTVTTREGMAMLRRGELGAYAMVDSYTPEEDVIPVARLGGSEFFFGVSKSRPDLLEQLNSALVRIFDEDGHYNEKLYAKYHRVTLSNPVLSAPIRKWLDRHGSIRVGYEDNALPFSAMDVKSRELTGALKNYLAQAETIFPTTRIHFQARPYPEVGDALKALKRGEIDCVFPVNLSLHEAEQAGVMVSNVAMRSQIFMIMRPDHHGAHLDSDNPATVSVHKGNRNGTAFLRENFPFWKAVSCSDPERCVDEVAAGMVDAFLVDGYRINEIEAMREQNNLILVPTGRQIPLSFAMNQTSTELYSVLNKIINKTREETVNTFLSHHAIPNAKLPLLLALRAHWETVLLVVVLVFVIFYVLLLEKLRDERKLNEQRKQIVSTRRMMLTDPGTGVKSRQAFQNAGTKIDQFIAEGTCQPFAVGVFDLNDLKRINDTLGHDAGDEYIRQGCRAVCNCFKHSPVYRIGGDEFAVIASGEDYGARDRLLAEFQEQMKQNRKDGKVVVAGAVAAFDSETDKTFQAVFERADSAMYQIKKALKAKDA